MPTEITLIKGPEKGGTRVVEDGIARALERRGMAKITGGFLFELREKQKGNGDGKITDPPEDPPEVKVTKEVTGPTIDKQVKEAGKSKNKKTK